MAPEEINLAWSYDLRTGWTEITDPVWSSAVTDVKAALSRAGFTTEFLRLGKNSFTLEVEVYRNDGPTGPSFYVGFVADDNLEHFFIANVPSLLAWLKDVAPIFQASVLSDLISPDFGDSMLDNFRSYLAGLVQAQHKGHKGRM